MNYIIDDVLVYCPDDGSVSRISKPEEIIMVLTPVLNRILLLLIENQGSLVPRDLFFEKVWDNYGKNASSHTLSQYMGVLRKIFENELGASCIDTIPKVGYMFLDTIKICKQEVIPLVSHDERFSLFTCWRKKMFVRFGEWGRNFFRSINIIVVVVFFLSIVLIKYDNLFFYGNEIKEYVEVDSCKVMLINSAVDNSRKENIEFMLKTFNLKCNINDSYYYSEGRLNNYNKFMFSRCFKHKNSSDECITYRIYRG